VSNQQSSGGRRIVYGPTVYYPPTFTPQDADDAKSVAASIAPVVDLFTREVVK